jgi:hypothetical protein
VLSSDQANMPTRYCMLDLGQKASAGIKRRKVRSNACLLPLALGLF